MVVGIWCGDSKPWIDEYLAPLITEIKCATSNGLTVNSHLIKIKVGRIVGDTPARSFIKGGFSF